MTNQEKNEAKMEFEDVLNREIGQFGKFQFINILLLGLPAIGSALLAGDYVFTAGKLPFRCAIPECDGDSPTYAPDWILNAVPKTSNGFEDCSRFAFRNVTQLLDETCSADLFDRDNIIPCDNFVYERKNSVVYDFGLECQEWLRALTTTLNSVGAMIALPIAGYVSDYFGRRVSIVLFAFNIVIIGIIKAFPVNYTMFLALHFTHTALGGGLFSSAYILAAEIVGPNYRVRTSATISSMFALGLALVGAIASVVHDWRMLTLAYFCPVAIILSYYWIICESHRWLLSKNKNEKAKAALERAANMNNRKISDEAMNYLLTAIPRATDTVKDDKNLILRVLKSPIMLRRCCTTPVYWIATTFIYYGLTINSVSLSGNIYLNYVLVSLVEIPGYWTAFLTLDKFGRRKTLFTSYTMCAVCCFAFAFTPNTMYGLSLFLYLTGKYCTGIVMTSMYLFTSELYPTRHRHSFLGFSSMLGRIGTVIASFTPPLMIYWSGIPSVLFASVSVITALLVLTQPETLGRDVPNTFEEAERLGRD